jgi:hypothetical protein
VGIAVLRLYGADDLVGVPGRVVEADYPGVADLVPAKLAAAPAAGLVADEPASLAIRPDVEQQAGHALNAIVGAFAVQRLAAHLPHTGTLLEANGSYRMF